VNLWYLVEKEVKPPTNPKNLAEYKKNAVKAKQVLLDSIKDYRIPHITIKSIAKEMSDSLGTLYQSVNVSRKLLLRNKLTTTCIC
jgi:hypothetical protein